MVLSHLWGVDWGMAYYDVDGAFALAGLGYRGLGGSSADGVPPRVIAADDEYRAVESMDEGGVDRPDQAAQGRLMRPAAHHDGNGRPVVGHGHQLVGRVTTPDDELPVHTRSLEHLFGSPPGRGLDHAQVLPGRPDGPR